MALSIQERLKDLRVECGLTLEQLTEQTGLSKSALGSYEADDFKDISHYALIKLAKFYGVTADYLLGLTETKSHPSTDHADLRLSDEMIDLLKSGRIDTALLCELAAHPDFVKLLADIQIYVEGIAATQIQNLNAWVDVARAEIMEDIREAHRGRSDSAPENTIVDELKRDLEEVASFKGIQGGGATTDGVLQADEASIPSCQRKKNNADPDCPKTELTKSYVPQRGKRK